MINNERFWTSRILLNIMISYLNGIIQNKRNNFVIINIGGVGYKVFVNEKLFSELKLGSEFEVYTYQHVREDALGVLAVAAIQDIRDTIARGDSSLLVKVSGIGKKTAERVVLELRDKVGYLAVSGVAGTTCDISSSRDEIDALIALGYSLQQAREALQKVDSQITDSGERIREALKGI